MGILGGGQLGRMLALAGIPMGLRFRFLERSADCPAAELGEVIVGDYTDDAALTRFARALTVATYEFENVPAATARWLTEHIPVFPPEPILAVAQERLAEKQLFRALGIATPDFAQIDNRDQLRAAVSTIGLPAVLKTRRLGYDGKGQWVLRTSADLDALPADLFARTAADLILEAFVPFTRELSIIAARSRTGELAFYPLTHNIHRGGILRQSIAPAPSLTPDFQPRAESIARRVLDHTGYVGILAIELFELADGALLANEMAPRVHNSGHWTQNAPGITSQFENHLRAILGWPLGPTAWTALGTPPLRGGSDSHPSPALSVLPTTSPTPGACGMLNILEALPDPAKVLTIPGVHLHLYGKSPRPGELRKVGHINVTAPNPETLATRLTQAAKLL